MPLSRAILNNCEELVPSALLYATSGDADDPRDERGPAPGIVLRDPSNAGAADPFQVRRGRVPIERHLDGEVRIHSSGDLGKGRMLWRRDGDPYFKGRADFCDLNHAVCAKQMLVGLFQSPHLLAMSNGNLLLVWADHLVDGATDNNWNWRCRTMDRRTYALGPVVTFPAVTTGGWSVDRGAAVPAFPGIDVTENPKQPGHLVAVGVADPTNSATASANLSKIVFTSKDYGASWKVQSISSAGGSSAHGYGVAVSYVGQRLALLRLGAVTGLYAFYSNDHGNTWTAGTISAQPASLSGRLDMEVTVNGALLAAVASAAGAAAAQAYWSPDGGQTWTLFTDPNIGQAQSRSTAVLVDDSGFPTVYSHADISGSFKSVFCVRSGVRAITAVEATSATSPLDGNEQVEEQALIDNFTSGTKDLSIEEIAATWWRGRVAFCLDYDDTSRKALMLGFCAEWNDLRFYTLHQQADSYSSWYYLYLPVSIPDTLGAGGYAWTLSGSGTVSLNEDGGLRMSDESLSSFTYTSPALANDPTNVRVLVRVLGGGSTSGNNVNLQVFNATADTRYILRLATTGFRVHDIVSGTNIGPEVLTDLTRPHEFVFVVNGTTFHQLYWRVYDPGEDGEHVPYNEYLSSTVSLNVGAIATSQVSIGLDGTGTGVVEWYEISQQRSATNNSATPTVPTPPVVRYDPDDAFQLYNAALTGMNFNTSDKGPQIADTSIDLADGVCVGWSGSGAMAGDRWTLRTRADFPGEAALQGGPSTPWASDRKVLLAGEEACYVLDAGEGRKFRANAIALFGLNAPNFHVEMNDADDWDSPPLSFQVGVDAAASNYALRLEESLGEVLTIDGNYVRMSTATSMVPGRYRPRGSRRWYLVSTLADVGTGHVWEIVDNAADAFLLSEAPDPGVNLTAGDEVGVYSDRILVKFGEVSSADLTVGYRFLRLRLAGDDEVHIHGREPYLKVGRVMLGEYLALPDQEWGFSVRYEPNVDLAEGIGGQVRAREVGPMRERWNLSFQADPPAVLEGDNAISDVNVWQRTRNLLLRSGQGLRPLVLVADAVNASVSTMRRATGDDLALVRMVGAIDAKHGGYWPIENPGQDDVDRIGDINALGGFAFIEEV